MSLIIKQKMDGSAKPRITLEMCRSGANTRAAVPERVVLPRLTDVAHMVLRIMTALVGLDRIPQGGLDDVALPAPISQMCTFSSGSATVAGDILCPRTSQ